MAVLRILVMLDLGLLLTCGGRGRNGADVAWVANSEIQQAEYFWALLSEQRAAVREKLDGQYAALARCQQGGHLSSVRRKRLVIREIESEVRAIDRMLHALSRLSA
jgi:hypothetical protein